MDKLKYIKLEKEDGSYSEPISLAVDGNNVDINEIKLTELIGNIEFEENGSIAEQVLKLKTKDNWVDNEFNKVVYLEDIVDNLDSVENEKSLSANQGKVLKTLIDQNKIYLSDTSNPIYYGADPKGIEDSTNAINQCIQENKNSTVNFTIGTYKITNQIELPYNMHEKVNINGNGATIIASGNFDTVFKCGVNNTDGQYNNVGYTSYINNLKINCKNADVTYAFDIAKGFKDLKLLNIVSYRTKNGIRIGESSGSPNDVLVNNCLFYGKGSEFEGTGIIVNCTDNYIENTRIYGFRTGFLVNGYIIINNTHVLLRWSNQTTGNFDPIQRNTEEFNNVYKLTSFAIMNSDARFYSCYADSVYKFLDISTSSPIILTNSFYYNARSNCDCMLFDLKNKDIFNLIISNNVFNISKNISGIGIHRDRTFNTHSQIHINNNIIRNIEKLTDPFDLIKKDVLNRRYNLSVSADNWYVVGLLANYQSSSACWINLFINSYLYTIRIGANATSITSIIQYLDSNKDTSYTFGVASDGDNKYLCIKPKQNINNLKFCVNLEYADNLIYNLFPWVPGQDPATSTLLLNEFTDLEPEKTLDLKVSLDNAIEE